MTVLKYLTIWWVLSIALNSSRLNLVEGFTDVTMVTHAGSLPKGNLNENTALITNSLMLDVTEDVSSHQDDRRGRWAWQPIEWSWVTISQLVCAVLGIIGNLLVALVVFQRRASSRSMDTLIGALAVADISTSIWLIPLPHAKLVPKTLLGSVYCKVVFGRMLFWLSMTASIYTLVAISLDRFFAITFPIPFNHYVTNVRVNIVVVSAWMVGILVVGAGFNLVTLDRAAGTCVYAFLSPSGQLAYTCFVLTARLLLPTLTLLMTQLLISRALYRQSKVFDKDETSGKTGASFHLVARARVINMMLLVIAIYVFAWGPNQLFFFGLNVGFVPFFYLNTPLHNSLTVLAFLNSCANPFVYTARHPQFRRALLEMIRGRPGYRAPVFGPDAKSKDETRVTRLSVITA